jgi:hypothetical protein
MGRDWQTWSAAMYLYAVVCVQQQRTPLFDELVRAPARSKNRESSQTD